MSRVKHILLLVLSLAFFFSPLIRSEDNFEDEEEEDIGNVIGIDLGTTYSVVGVYRNGKVEIIANEQGERITPSYVAFTEEERLVGESAKNQVEQNPTNTVFSAKRLIGRQFSERTVREDIKLLPYEVISKNGKPFIKVKSRNKEQGFYPKEISAMVLGKMKEIAESYLGEEVKNCVVTVPAYFNDAQRKATQEAGVIAGLNVLRIINEPTAAAIAYGLDKKSKKEINVLVYDLGGGTFDVSILTIDGGVFEVKSTNGDTHLGGEDFDLELAKYVVGEFRKKTGIDLMKNKKAFAKIKKEAEVAKRGLSGKLQATIHIDNIVAGHDLKVSVTRAKFESLSMKHFENTLKPVKTVLADAGMKTSDIDEVVLVGGSTRIPIVQNLLNKFFEGKKLNKKINPDEAIAYGAAVQGFILSGKDDEETKDMLLLDVTPLSLGIETVGGVLTKIINKNTPIPTKETRTFTTNDNDQTTVTISIYEGEARMVQNAHMLGRFDLNGIDKAPRGVPQIEVVFDVDANGRLLVSAKDKSSGKNNELKIDEAMSDKPEQLKEMMEKYEEMKDKDELLFNRTEAKNKLLYSLNAAEDYKEKEKKNLIKEDIEDLEKLIADSREWANNAQVAETEVSAYKEKTNELEEVLKEIKAGESGEKGEEAEESADEADEKGEEEPERDEGKKEL